MKFRNKSQKFQKKKPYKKKGLFDSALESKCEDSLEYESNKYLLMALKTDSKKQGIMDSEEEEDEGTVAATKEGTYISNNQEFAYHK